MDKPVYRPIMLGIAGAFFLAVFALPRAGETAREQLGMMYLPSQALYNNLSALGTNNTPFDNRAAAQAQHKAAVHEYARKHPNDLAAALTDTMVSLQPDLTDSENGQPVNNALPIERQKRLRALQIRFPQSKELIAHTLRYATTGLVKIGRDEEQRLLEATSHPPSNPPNMPSQLRSALPSDESQVAIFLEDARKGETLDPQNAFFPEMASVALFAQKRDALALAELHRAALCPQWDDYATHEVQCLLEVNTRIAGHQTPIMRLTTQAAELFPHFASIRGASRIAVIQAVAEEKKGDRLKGLAIRKDVMRIGGLMRAQSHSLIGGLVGMAITGIATSRPGGEMPIVVMPRTDSDKSRAEREKRYIDYLLANNWPEEARYAMRELEASKTSRAAINGALEIGPTSPQYIVKYTLHWMVGLMILGSCIVLLGMGVTAYFLLKLRTEQDNVSLFTILGVGILVAIFNHGADVASSFGLTLAVMSSMMGEGTAQGQNGLGSASPFLLRLLFLFLILMIPAIVVIISWLNGLVVREPPVQATLNGLLKGGAVTVCLLIIGYISLINNLQAQDHEITQAMDRQMKHEGRYDAELVHHQWPDRVIPPP